MCIFDPTKLLGFGRGRRCRYRCGITFGSLSGFSPLLLLERLSDQGTCAAYEPDGFVDNGGGELGDEKQGQLNGGRVKQDTEGCNS